MALGQVMTMALPAATTTANTTAAQRQAQAAALFAQYDATSFADPIRRNNLRHTIIALAGRASAQAAAMFAQYDATGRTDPLRRNNLRSAIVAAAAFGAATPPAPAATTTANAHRYRNPGTPAQEAALQVLFSHIPGGDRGLLAVIKAASPWRLNPVVVTDTLVGWWYGLPYVTRLGIVQRALPVTVMATKAGGAIVPSVAPSGGPYSAAPAPMPMPMPTYGSIVAGMQGFGSYYESLD